MFKLVLLSIAIFQGIIIGIILLSSPFFKNKINKFLAFALFSISFSLLKIALDISQIFEVYPFLRFIEVIDSEALLPVFVFLFIAHQVNNVKLNFRKTFWLFIPALISTLGFGYLEFGLNNEISEEISLYNIVIAISILVVLLIFYPYILYKTYKVIQYSKHKLEKKWLTYLWSFELFILGSLMLIVILAPFMISEILNTLQILALISTLLVHWIAYTGVYKLKLLNDRNKIKNLIKYSKSESEAAHTFESFEQPIAIKKQIVISEDNSYYQKLENLCSVQQIYRDSSLDRNSVAEVLGISPSYVSQLINSITSENFSTYINRYRVEEVKRLILDQEFKNYSLLAIGLECGFSSKTTFHNSFKKITGMTPNAYRKKYK